MKKRILVLVLSLLSFSALADKDEAVEAASSWLGIIDADNFAESWDETASLFKRLLSRDQWVSMLDGVRTPLGALVGRELESTTAETTLPGAPDGNYWIIVFNTRFANKASAVETLVMIDEEGKWLPVGYYIR